MRTKVVLVPRHANPPSRCGPLRAGARRVQAAHHRQKQQPAQGGATGAAASSGSEVLIGATLPLTGAESRIGGFFKEGYELAFEEANKAGGISVGGKKMPVKL